MAQLAAVSESTDQVDVLLTRALTVWARLPEVERSIDTWDRMDLVDFLEEWPLEEQRLRKLEEWATTGGLNATQQARFHDLRVLVTKNRPIIQRLLSSG